MGRKIEACAECSRSCLSLHRNKNDPYPLVSSFFKVMFGKQFSEELIVPPRFARTLTSLEGKRTNLEDPTGQKWNVDLCNVNGSLVFRKGWHEFAVDHGIELGDFVVFHHIKGSHFVVQIFTRSGCEKPALSGEKNYLTKRRKVAKDSIVGNDHSELSNIESPPNEHCLDSSAVDIQRQDNVRKLSAVAADFSNAEYISKRPKLAASEDLLAEPDFTANRSTTFSGEDDRDHLFDMSAFEMSAKEVHASKTSIIIKTSCCEVVKKVQDTQKGVTALDVEKCQFAEDDSVPVSSGTYLLEKECSPQPKSRLNIELSSSSTSVQKSISSLLAPESSFATDNSQPSGGGTQVVVKDQKSSQNLCLDVSDHDQLSPRVEPIINYEGTKIVEKESESSPNFGDYGMAHPPLSISYDNMLSPGMEPIIKNGGMEVAEEERESCHGDYGVAFPLYISYDNLLSPRKEPIIGDVDLGYSSNKVVHEGNLTMSVKSEAADICDFSLPVVAKITCTVKQDGESFLELPECLPVKICRQGAKLQQKLVFLRDPTGRLWPVVYQEWKRLNVLAKGWKEFRKSNSIQPWDQCTFEVENIDEGIFKVYIFRS